ncbi:MAG: LuxR C-terminal-related transcriptional regulator [Dehalococcoidia bacterium]
MQPAGERTSEVPDLAVVSALIAGGRYTAACEAAAIAARRWSNPPIALLAAWEDVAFAIRTGRLEAPRAEVLPLLPALEKASQRPGLSLDERGIIAGAIARQKAWHDPAATRDEAARAVAIAREAGHDPALITALYALHIALEDPARITERLDVSRELADLCGASFDPAVRATGHWRRLIDALTAGDPVDFDWRMQALETAANESGQAYPALTAAMARGCAELMRGNYEAAQALLPAMREGYRQHSGLLTAAIVALTTMPGFERGRRSSGTSITQTVAKARRLPAFRIAMAYMLATSGRAFEARHEIAEIDLQSLPRDSSLLPCLCMVIDLGATHLDDRELVATAYEMLRPFETLMAVTGDAQSCWGPSALYLGIAARTLGLNDEAAHLDIAQRLSASFGARPTLARALLMQADLATTPESAVAMRQEALQIAERVRLAPIAAEARNALRPVLTRESRKRPTELTAREREVLAATARGLSAAEVGEELVLSPRTVAKHLENTYAKIGARTRGEAIAWAIQNGLVDGVE